MAKRFQKTKSADFEQVDDAQSEPLPMGTNYLLAIAINEYQHCTRLNNCVRDAEKIVQKLTQQYTFTSNNVKKLYDKDATAENILLALEACATNIGEHDSLVILFSGHGDNSREIGFWIPVDAKNHHTPDYLPVSTILDYLEPIKARHIFIISDSCFSGKLLEKTRSSGPIGRYNKLESKPSRYALTAGRNEPVLDGSLGNHSPFIKVLLDVLDKTQEPLGMQALCADISQSFENEPGQQPNHGWLNITLNGNNIKSNDRGQFYFRRKTDLEKKEHLELGRQLLLLAHKIPDPAIYRSAALHFEHAYAGLEKENPLWEAMYWQAQALQGAGDFEQAMKLFKDFIEIHKDQLPIENIR